MSRAKRLAATLASALVLLAAFWPGSPPAAGGLEVQGTERVAPRLLDFTLSTDALAGPTHVRVLLPAGYRDSRKRYPVLYLLHGAGGSYASWSEAAAKLARTRPLIVVMPDGGPAGFYSDWFNDGRGGPPMWETYHVGELVPWVDSRFRTKAGKRARAVAGYSMGGFGALSYAARHPELFAVAASFSGVVDSNDPGLWPIFESARTPAGNPAVWGPRDTQEARWRAHNPVDLAAQLRTVRVLLFTGNGQPGGVHGGGPDSFEAEIEKANLTLDTRLDQLGIGHRFVDGPGTHSFGYAKDDLSATLRFLMRALPHPKRGRTARMHVHHQG
jgi:S-formylglutathione hydrolase FrmB